MTSLSLILCEGAHDRAFLLGLATVCGGWHVFNGRRDDLPEAFNSSYPQPSLSSSGWPRFIPLPWYLRKEDRWLELRALGGIDEVLGKTGVRFVEARLNDPLTGLGIVVDADDSRIASRVDSFRDRYKKVLGSAQDAVAGKVVDGSPRVGFWVAPNNEDTGSLADTLLTAGKRTRPKLIIEAEKFVQAAARYGEMRPKESRAKPIAGCTVQVDIPGTSLATALMALPKKWLTPDLAKVEPFSGLLEFVDTLTA